ncbi:hypothetical protein [Tritonibacter scottomollicae]|uniref:hypothetical protein n=1 Tax=Tritonibacter scottomollicae TaxID=483013 RepID=UPI001A9D8202|nr:hypothetical protein [Tritonibacter scottomollicae]
MLGNDLSVATGVSAQISSDGTTQLTGDLSLDGDLSLSASSGVLTLASGNVTSGAGATLSIDAGTVALGSSGAVALLADAPLSIAAGAAFDLAGEDTTISALSGDGRIFTSELDGLDGTTDLVIASTGAGGFNGTFDGTEEALALETTGDVTFGGAFDGLEGVTVSSGTLTLSTTMDANSSITVDGGTLSNAGTITGDVTVRDGTFSNTATIRGMTLAEAGTVLSANNGTFDGDVTINGEDLPAAAAEANFSGMTSITGDLQNAGNLTNDGTLTVTGAFTSAGRVTNTGTIVNALTMAGDGSLIQNGTTSGLVTLSDTASLTTNGGSFAGLMISENASATLSGAITSSGDVTNLGRLASSDSVATTLTVTGGRFVNIGDLVGGTSGLVVTADEIEVVTGSSITGNVSLDAALRVAGSLELSSDLTHSLTIVDTGEVTVTAEISGTDQSLSNDGTLVLADDTGLTGLAQYAGAGRLDLGQNAAFSAADLSIGGTATLAAGASLTGADRFVIAEDGRLLTAAGGGTVLISAASGLNIEAEGVLDVAAGDTLSGTGLDLSNSGGVNIGTGAALTLASLQSDGEVTNSGTLTVTDAITLSGGSVTNTGAISGAVAVSGGALTNSGTVTGDVTLTGGTVTTSGTISGATSVGADAVLVSQGGSFSDDVLIAEEGRLELSGTTSVAGDVTNDGVIIATQSGAALSVTGVLTINGTIDGSVGTFSVGADVVRLAADAVVSDVIFDAEVENAGTLELGRDLTAAQDVTTLAGSTTRVTAQIAGNGVDITNAGSFEIEAGTGLTGLGVLRNSNALTIGAGAELTAQSIHNSGTLAIGAGGTLEGLGNTLDNSGTLTLADGASVLDAGAINNADGGLIRFDGSGTIAANLGDTDTAINNAGQIVTAGASGDTVTIGDGSANVFNNLQDGEFILGAGTVVSATQTDLRNAGTVEINSGARLGLDELSNSGSLSNAGTLSVAGGLANTGNFENTGTLTADLTQTVGSTINSGTLGNVTQSGGTGSNSGTVTGALALSGGTFTNGGTGVIGQVSVTGGTLTNAGAISGTLTLSDAQGWVTNSGSVLGQTAVSDGVLNTAGSLAGLDLSGGTVTNTGTITGGATVTGGSLNTEQLSGGLDLSGGSVTNTGAISGAVAVSGGALTNSGTVTGDVTLTGGTVTTSGTISGATSVGADAVLVSQGGSFGDDVLIAEEGRLELSGTTSVAGDVTNDGVIIATQSGAALSVTGVLTINGTIDGSVGSFSVGADVVRLAADAVVSDVIFDAEVENAGTLELGRDLTAAQDVTTLAGSTTRVTAQIAGNGVDITNAGSFEIEAGAGLTGLGVLRNSNALTIGAGAELTAQSIHNSGTLAIGAGGTLEGLGNTLDNSGTLTLADGASVLDAGAINNADGGLIRFDGSGTIAANLGDTDTAINNAGQIVTAGASGDTVTIGDGSANVFNNLQDGEFILGAGTVVSATQTDLRNAGTVAINSGARLGLDELSNSGSLSNAGTLSVAGGLANTGSFENTGTLTADLTQTAGSTINSGTLGNVTQSGGSFTQTAGASAALTFTGGTGSLEGGSVSGTLSISNAVVVVGEDATVTGSSTVESDGTLGIAGTVADVTSAGTLSLSGTADQVSITDGTFVAEGASLGTLALSGASVSSASGDISGNLTLGDSAALTVSGDLSLGGAVSQVSSDVLVTLQDGTFTLASGLYENTANLLFDGGTLAADLENTAMLELRSGTLAGDLDNSGNAALAGQISGGLNNAEGGVVAVASGAAAGITGETANFGTFSVAGDLTVGDTFRNGSADATDAAFGIVGGTFAAADMENFGTLALTDAGVAAGTLRNMGQMQALGTSSISGNFTNTSDGVLSLADDDISTRLTIDGNADLSGVVAVDIDLATTGAQGVDQISVSGAVSGNVVFAFNNLSGADQPALDAPLSVLSYGSNGGLSVSSTGLPSTGAILYALSNDTSGGQVSLVSGANPAFAGLASGLTVAQSLMGSVINRPTSPYISGLAAAGEGDDLCGNGAWARATGGRVSASGSAETQLGQFESVVDATYGGLQFGFDNSCFKGVIGGWNLSYGVIGGVNRGTITQPVFFFDTQTATLNESIVTSRNDIEFDQIYGGVYLGASKGRWVADLQARTDRTSYDLQNRAAAGPFGERLGADDQSYDSSGSTISGSLGYAIPLTGLGEGINFIPTLGFAYSRTTADSVYFSNDKSDPDDDGVLEFDPITNKVGFASLTLSRSTVRPSGLAALNYFGTLSYYRDFADVAGASYYQLDAAGNKLGAPLDASNDLLSEYGELSLGLNYTRILDPGSAFLSARQLDTSIRVDGRFGDQLDGWGVTAQMRLQF